MKDFFLLKPCFYTFSNFSTLKVSGPDAKTYLHSQTTNEVLKLKGRFNINALVDISGRLISYFFVLEDRGDYFLSIPIELFDKTLERLEKYHISEDLKFERSSEKVTIGFHQGSNGDLGSYAGLLSLEELAGSELSEQEFNELCLLVGFPILRQSIFENELINNTLLNFYAVDYNKGCYPGQETVAKIETRRGAALAPIYLKGALNFDEIKIDDKKIGTRLGSFELNGESWNLCSLQREFRVHGKEILIDGQKLICFAYPIYSKEIAVENLYHKAIKEFQADNLEFAISCLKQIIQFAPDYADAYESLGVIYGRQQKFEDAISIMHELEKLDEKSVMAQTNLSMFYMKIGEIEKAEKHKGNATLNQFHQLGDEAETKKKQEEEKKAQEEELLRREKMFLQVLDIDPQDSLAAYGLGSIRLDQKRFDEAIDLLKKAIEGDKKYSVAYLALGKAYINDSKIKEAKETLEHGISVASKNGDLMPANEMQAILLEL